MRTTPGGNCAEPRHAAAGSAALAGDQRPASAAAAPGAAAQVLRAQHVRLLLAALLTEAAMWLPCMTSLPSPHNLAFKLFGAVAGCMVPEDNPAAAHGRLGPRARAQLVLPLPVQQRSMGRPDAAAASPCTGAGPAGLQGSQETAELAGAKLSGPLVDWGVGSFAGGAGCSAGSLDDDLSLRGAPLRSSPSTQQEAATTAPMSVAAPDVGAQRHLRRSRSAQGASPSSPPLALGTGAVRGPGAMLEPRGAAPQQEGPGRTSSDGAQLGQLPLVRAGSAWSGQPEDVPLGRDAGRPVALELRLPPLHPKLSARLALLAAGGGSLFAGEPGSFGVTCWPHPVTCPQSHALTASAYRVFRKRGPMLAFATPAGPGLLPLPGKHYLSARTVRISITACEALGQPCRALHTRRLAALGQHGGRPMPSSGLWLVWRRWC